MPDYIFAFSSAILWAISAPVINHALVSIPRGESTQWIFTGLFFALGSGIITLTPFVIYLKSPININIYIILSGIFTFPLATGAYYISANSFSKRTEFASLFSKTKPLFTFVFAIFIIGESISQYTFISALLVTFGIILLFTGMVHGSISRTGIVYGLITAISWSIGEVFMKLGIQNNHPVVATWAALISGMVIFSAVAIPMIPKIIKHPMKTTILGPFCLHGIISFGIAYSLFFYSVNLIGLGRSALINAFWPILGIFIAAAIRYYRGQQVAIPRIVILAAIFLLAGSLVQAALEF